MVFIIFLTVECVPRIFNLHEPRQSFLCILLYINDRVIVILSSLEPNEPHLFISDGIIGRYIKMWTMF